MIYLNDLSASEAPKQSISPSISHAPTTIWPYSSSPQPTMSPVLILALLAPAAAVTVNLYGDDDFANPSDLSPKQEAYLKDMTTEKAIEQLNNGFQGVGVTVFKRPQEIQTQPR